MLTERGWGVLGAAVALGVLWVLLGEIELLAAAAVAAAAVGFGLVFTRLDRPRVEISRRLTPSLVHEGDQATVNATVANRGRRPLANVTLVDEVGSLGDAEFQVGHLAVGPAVTARYQIVCHTRGVYTIGPARVRVTDPVGVAATEATTGTLDRLIVYPSTETLHGFPLTRGRDPAMQASRPEFSHRGGEDFYTLREYAIGDDLRHVHWPSSARQDELMIRQLETPWQSRALVLLDVRGKVYESEACFEKAVSGAASVIRHLAGAGFDADVWAGGRTTISVSQYALVMEQLALVQPVARLDIRTVAARMRHTGPGGALVLVTGVADHDLLEVHRLMGRDYRTTILLSAAEATSSSEMAFQRSGALTTTVPPSGSWAEGWSRLTDRSWTDRDPRQGKWRGVSAS